MSTSLRRSSLCALRCFSGGLLLAVALTSCKVDSGSQQAGPQPNASSQAASGTSAPQPPAASAPANGLPTPAASVAAAINPQDLPAYSGPTGSVEGTIFITGDTPRALPNLDFKQCPAGAAFYGKLFREGPSVSTAEGAKRTLPDAIVAITGYSGYYVPERNEAKRVTFTGCSLPSRTITMTFGQRLEIANDSMLLFAPEFLQVASPAALIAPPKLRGEPVKLYPPHPGYYTLVDQVHAISFLRADVYAFQHSLHTVSDSNGHYRIDGVPTGSLDVHARLGIIDKNTAQKVEIRENVVVTVDLTLNYDAATDAVGSTLDAGLRHAPVW